MMETMDLVNEIINNKKLMFIIGSICAGAAFGIYMSGIVIKE